MGQYWMIFNLTAKKFIDPRDWGASRKQGTLGYNEQNITWALIRLLQTKWRGHQIIISGDYADDETEHIEAFGAAPEAKNLYKAAEDDSSKSADREAKDAISEETSEDLAIVSLDKNEYVPIDKWGFEEEGYWSTFGKGDSCSDSESEGNGGPSRSAFRRHNRRFDAPKPYRHNPEYDAPKPEWPLKVASLLSNPYAVEAGGGDFPEDWRQNGRWAGDRLAVVPLGDPILAPCKDISRYCQLIDRR